MWRGAQGDQEKKEGLPVSPNMDRETTSQAQLSLNFTDFIVAPLMVALTNLVPGNALACEHMSARRAPVNGVPRLLTDSCLPCVLQAPTAPDGSPWWTAT